MQEKFLKIYIEAKSAVILERIEYVFFKRIFCGEFMRLQLIEIQYIRYIYVYSYRFNVSIN